MRDPRGELFRVYWGFTANREAARKFGTLTEPFQWEQGRWASALAVLGTGQAPGWGWFRQGSYLRGLRLFMGEVSTKGRTRW